MPDSTSRLEELIKKHRTEFQQEFGVEETRKVWPAVQKMLGHAYYTGQGAFARNLARSFRTSRSRTS